MSDETPGGLIKLVTLPRTRLAVAQDPNGAIRFAVDGTIEVQNREALKDLVVERLEKGDRQLVLDCRRCGYIDSSGLGVIVSLSKKTRDLGGALWVEGLNPDLKTLFELTKLDTVVLMRDAKEKADG